MRNIYDHGWSVLECRLVGCIFVAMVHIACRYYEYSVFSCMWYIGAMCAACWYCELREWALCVRVWVLYVLVWMVFLFCECYMCSVWVLWVQSMGSVHAVCGSYVCSRVICVACIGALCGFAGTMCAFWRCVYRVWVLYTQSVGTVSLVCRSVFLHWLVPIPESMFSNPAREHKEDASHDVWLSLVFWPIRESKGL